MPATVILIDDDQDDLEMVAEALKAKDPSVLCITFTRAEEAIQAIDELVVFPDYIILDVNMPKMSGDQCLRILRNRSELKGTAIIVLSTGMTKPVAARLRKLGATHTFSKPSTLEALNKIIDTTFC